MLIINEIQVILSIMVKADFSARNTLKDRHLFEGVFESGEMMRWLCFKRLK